jgi:hypothetical protein
MARIRTIKPEFWSSEQVMDCSPMARLLFIGLWNFCDDGGNHVASAKTVKAEIFPGDDITSSTVQGLLDELSSNSLIAYYTSENKDFLHITGWHHQKIDRPTYKHPPFNGDSSNNTRRALVEPSPPEGKGMDIEGKGEEKKTIPPNPPAGGNPGTLREKKARVKSERTTLKTFLEGCKTKGEKPISEYEPLTRYMAESGLPAEFVNLCWCEFKRRFLPGGTGEKKLQAQWRRHFQNFVERNYFKLWYAKPQGDGVVYELTTVGLQAQAAQQRREAA